MSRTVVKQNPDDDFTATIRASRGRNRLVQYGERNFKVRKFEDLDIMDQDSDEIPGFDSEAGQKCVEAKGYYGIKLDGFIKFDNRYILVFFHDSDDKKKKLMWMLKTNLSSGWNSTCKKALNEFTANNKNDWSRDRQSDGDHAIDTETQSVNDNNRHKGNSKDASDSEHEGSIITKQKRSRAARSTESKASSSSGGRYESPERSDFSDSRSPSQERVRTTRSTDSNTRSSRNKRHESRERSESADENSKRSGDTPGPRDRDGGDVIYGRECWGVIRAIVKRGKAYDIELVDACPKNCQAPKNDVQSFGPAVDARFFELQFAAGTLNTSNIKVVGCAAKWNGKPKTWIYVLISIQNENVRQELLDYREKAKEKYQGHLICNLSTYRKVIKNDKEKLQKLVDHLKVSLFWQDATEKERMDVEKSIKGTRAKGSKSKKLEA